MEPACLSPPLIAFPFSFQELLNVAYSDSYKLTVSSHIALPVYVYRGQVGPLIPLLLPGTILAPI